MKRRGRILVRCFSALMSISMAACGGGGGRGVSSFVPASTSGGNVLDTNAVAAYGPTETALLKTIADARAQGKTVRYTTVSTAEHAYVFSPRARVYRTTTSLIAHAFHHEYVWPINNVTVSYSGSGVVPVSDTPASQRSACRRHDRAHGVARCIEGYDAEPGWKSMQRMRCGLPATRSEEQRENTGCFDA